MAEQVTEERTTTGATRQSIATAGYRYVAGRLACSGVALDGVAERVGTPCYVYDAEGMRGRYHALSRVLAPMRAEIYYAVKANPCLAVAHLFAELGAGMDVVSMGEMERGWLAGAPMERMCFAGVSKSDAWLRAALDGSHSPLVGSALVSGGRRVEERGPIGVINAESESEIERLDAIARELGVVADYTIRLSPGVTAGANDKVRVGAKATKFGQPPEDLFAMVGRCSRLQSVCFRGLHMHIGSQIDDLSRFDAALAVLTALADRLRDAGHRVDVLNVGAGVAVSYVGEAAPSDEAYGEVLRTHLERFARDGCRIIVEPGRELVGQAGVMLTRVCHVKHAGGREIVTTDAGLNALVRPAMYGAQHTVWPVACAPEHGLDPIAPPMSTASLPTMDVVGPVCESSDVFARDWPMPRVQRGDVLAVFTAGAYGMSMAMSFNDLPLPAEVLIDASGVSVVREHQTFEALLGPTVGGLSGGRRIDLS
jgi:diaminopimelate decarboxylase